MLFRSDRKSTRLNSSHTIISYAVFCLKKKNNCGSGFLALAPGTPHVPQDVQRRVAWRAGTGVGIPARDGCGSEAVRLWVFFLNDRGTPEISPLPLRDALPI